MYVCQIYKMSSFIIWNIENWIVKLIACYISYYRCTYLCCVVLFFYRYKHNHFQTLSKVRALPLLLKILHDAQLPHGPLLLITTSTPYRQVEQNLRLFLGCSFESLKPVLQHTHVRVCNSPACNKRPIFIEGFHSSYQYIRHQF